MKTTDFSRSFLSFRIDLLKKPTITGSHKPPYTLNSARIQLDCVCTIREKEGEYEERFVLGANCKTERVGVDEDIWTEPNADFRPILGESDFLAIKTFDQAGKERAIVPALPGDAAG